MPRRTPMADRQRPIIRAEFRHKVFTVARSCGKCKRTRWQNWSGWQTGSGFGNAWRLSTTSDEFMLSRPILSILRMLGFSGWTHVLDELGQ